MEVNFATREMAHQSQFPLPNNNLLLLVKICNSLIFLLIFSFFLNNYFLPTSFLPSGNSTKSQASLLLKALISSTMAFFHSSPSSELTATSIDLGSSLIEDITKDE